MKPVNHYAVHHGLFAGEYPGDLSPNVAETRVRELVDKGVRTFIDLTSHEDGLQPYEPIFMEVDIDGTMGLKRYSFEIPDMKIPSGPAVMRGVMDLIRSEIEAGRPCYVHCWGGIGRTGTAVGCWLRENGMNPAAALAEVQRLYETHMDEAKRARYPRSPQQPTQLKYVTDWPGRPE
ncbi:serine/threonine protein phosphatase [Luteolibacter sp. Populi]|uniref:protein-tyrosine phosphatase family protein n=1 Tax=Luteolibacter sp. Populi TaxID=3230487 RepID=UPI003467B11F